MHSPALIYYKKYSIEEKILQIIAYIVRNYFERKPRLIILLKMKILDSEWLYLDNML